MPDQAALHTLRDEARGLAAEGEWAKLVALVAPLHPADLADLVLELDPDDRHSLIMELPWDLVGQLFEFVRDDDLRDLIESVGMESLPAALEEADDDVAADVIQELEPEEQATALAALDQGEAVAGLLEYGPESAGGIMSRGFVAFQEDTTAEAAISFLRDSRPPSDRAYYLYVTGPDNRLQGIVSLRDLIVAAPETPLRDFVQRDVHAVSTDTDQEAAALILKRYNLLAVPVVDADGRLEGVTIADDLIDVLSEEATEDMYRMVGLDETERVFSPIRTSIRRRLPWMTINLIATFTAAAMISLFDSTIAKATVLAAFMPVVAGQGGNAGAQTATITVRSIALGDLAVGDVLRATRKEIVVGVANGIVIGVLAGVAVMFWEQNTALALVVGIALVLTISFATVFGVAIPLALKAMKIDPALAANIFVTGLTDVLGFLFFLGLAAVAIDQIV
jgi:magnesium transporter